MGLCVGVQQSWSAFPGDILWVVSPYLLWENAFGIKRTVGNATTITWGLFFESIDWQVHVEAGMGHQENLEIPRESFWIVIYDLQHPLFDSCTPCTQTSLRMLWARHLSISVWTIVFAALDLLSKNQVQFPAVWVKQCHMPCLPSPSHHHFFLVV